MTKKKLKMPKFETITSTGKLKKMPKTVMLFGKKFKAFKKPFKIIQKLELKEFKEFKAKMKNKR